MSTSQKRMVDSYDKSMVHPIHAKYYGHSDFYNYGYWGSGATNQKEASEALVDKLLEMIPDKSGTILDVACGLGATTRQVAKQYPPESVTAINLSEAQLARGRQNAPGANFMLMDAVKLEFPDDTFDNIICVEAAFHFETRLKFYGEALRVLKPGGYLVTSDIGGGPKWVWKHNLLKDAAELEAQTEQVGFQNVTIDELTAQCWGGFCKNLRAWGGKARAAGTLSRGEAFYMRLFSAAYPPLIGIGVKQYYLTSAQKPPTVQIEDAAPLEQEETSD